MHNVGMLIMTHEYATSIIDVLSPILCLTIQSHNSFISADAEIVFGRNTTGVIECSFASQHHGSLRCHDENATGVHQHGRFGIPIRLRPDVNAIDNEVHLPARLSEFDKTAQYTSNPIHVLNAAFHGDLRSSGKGIPLQRDT